MRAALRAHALAFWSQNALQTNDVVLTREAVDELASYMRERLELRPVGFRPVAVEMGSKMGTRASRASWAGTSSKPAMRRCPISSKRTGPRCFCLVGTTAMHRGSRNSKARYRTRFPL